ncbi:MAG: hypothetical protein AAGF12_42760 [Myxococcota bacterium]
MPMTLGDGFNRRKKLRADFDTWVNRLTQSGIDRRTFRTMRIDGDGAFAPEPGTDKLSTRHYSIEECREHIDAIITEDRTLALRISLTNQTARATVIDLDGREVELTVPELLVLKNDIIPKLEQVARSIPTRKTGVNVIAEERGTTKHRAIKKLERKKESFNEHGLKIEEMELLGYDVSETTDYGIPQRDAWNEIDRIHDYAQRVKEAVNEANKAELVELPR